MAYENPKCTRCGKEIKFIVVKTYKGELKNIPVEVKDEYLTTMTEEKTDKGAFIWKSSKIAVPHKCEGGN